MLLSSFLALQFVRTKHRRNLWENITEEFEKSILKRGLNLKNIEGYKELSAEDAKLFQMHSISKADDFTPHFLTKLGFY